jgi:hypothetical protein
MDEVTTKYAKYAKREMGTKGARITKGNYPGVKIVVTPAVVMCLEASSLTPSPLPCAKVEGVTAGSLRTV